MEKIKTIIKKLLQNSKFEYFFIYLYQIIFKKRGREKFLSRNRKSDLFLYVIRPRYNTIEGLMSLFLYVLQNINYAKENNYNFYIDFKNYKTQYFIEQKNAWEFFFEQPDIKENQASEFENVILSGFTLKKIKRPEELFTDKVFFDTEIKSRSKALIKKYIIYSDEVKLLLEEFKEKYPFINESLGVYIRGTDYVKLKPVGEHVQPSVDQMLFKLSDFKNKYNISKIYVVTEDFDLYEQIKIRYPENVFTINESNFIKNYDGKDYLCNTSLLNQNKKERGMEYLLKILMLSECKYFISSITMGSISAYLLKQSDYEDEYIFDLGRY